MHASSNDSIPLRGMVVRKAVNSFHIRAGDRILEGAPGPRLRHLAGSDPVVVGDQVLCDASGQILEVLPRRNRLSRRGVASRMGAHSGEQVIAANLDQVVPVFAAADPRPAWNLLDRYLVAAESAGIPAAVCITKMDLVAGRPEADEIEAVAAEYRAIGYPLVLTSLVTGRGLAELRSMLHGRLSILAGKSGVGKSSLLNALEPGLGLRIRAVSNATHKGRHTTAHVEMIELDGGGAIVDTPGIREFGLWDVAAGDLALFFPEMRPFVGLCRFRLDCRHDAEPGCAVRKAVMDGQVSPYRYQSYLKLRSQP